MSQEISRYFFSSKRKLYVDLAEIVEMTVDEDGDWNIVYKTAGEISYLDEKQGDIIFDALTRYRSQRI